MAIIYTAAAIPAFIWMQDNRRVAFLGIGNVNVYLTALDALVTSIAFLWVKMDWSIGSLHIGQSMNFLGHIFLLTIFTVSKVLFMVVLLQGTPLFQRLICFKEIFIKLTWDMEFVGVDLDLPKSFG
jgi:hypothetical protein